MIDHAAGLTWTASAMAKPPPNSMMTPHCILACTVGQSSSGGAGPGGVGSTAAADRHWATLTFDLAFR